MSIFEYSETYRPFVNPWAVEEASRQAIDMFWDKHQIDLVEDVRQYSSGGLGTDNVTHEQAKAIIDSTICLFTEMDRVVGEGYTYLLPMVKNNEIRNVLITQTATEVKHQRCYAIAAETFGFPDSAWLAFSDYKEMVDKLDVMADDYFDRETSSKAFTFAAKLTQIAIGEGIGLYAAFANLLNFKRFGKLVGFNDVNQWSLLDEQRHVETNFRIIKMVREQDLTEKERIELEQYTRMLIKEYVKAEHAYIDLVYRMSDQEELTKEEMKEYILYLEDLRLYQLGYLFASEVRENPLPWMEWLLAGGKDDKFFEKKVTDYLHKKLEGKVDYSAYFKQLEFKLQHL